MTLSDLLSGKALPLISDLIVLVILSLMLVMSIRLWQDRRKRAYRSLTVSICIVMAHYGLQLYFHLAEPASGAATYWTSVLKIVSFLLVNMGVYQLYNPTLPRHRVLFVFFLALTFAVSLLHVFVPHWFAGTEAQERLLQDIGLELYLFVLIFLGFYLISPFIGQTGKYQAALTVYFTGHIAHVLNQYVFGGEQTALGLLEHVLPIAFYFLLFMLLFDRVVELMHAIYSTSITDGLTRLYNRKFFDKRVTQYVQRGYPVAVMFSDIDNFKKLNDTKGHHVGDEVLKQVADILRQESEECGVAGRYGGEEMVVLVTDPAVNIAEFAEHVRRRVESETTVTVSLGCCKIRRGMTAEELIRRADEAMYKAKTSGKNKVVSYG
ncbi:diguanylate cyclase [Gordoniibacillus kamchatkensis]|uniref:Diguanylate cyclase n=1 Tax=Gordoniibacillus kamchatkensis TaxID=1590651 RepID=A0ABR5AB86_9BACL|nr:GGDEF domain-containing protein [Paenibacillus sp. VKM B-2647]KIL38252.1 diguanylate cyclase [Paenibacillus sp. VKM B-2647]